MASYLKTIQCSQYIIGPETSSALIIINRWVLLGTKGMP